MPNSSQPSYIHSQDSPQSGKPRVKQQGDGFGANAFADSDSQNERLRRQIKWHLLLRVLLISFLLGTSTLLKTTRSSIYMPAPYAIALFISFIYLFSIISAALTNKLSRFQTFTYLQVLADATLTTIIIYYSGGSRSIFTFVYFFPLISGGLLLFRRGALLISSFSSICYALILSTEHPLFISYFPYFSTRNSLTNSNALLQIFAVYGISFFLVSILSAILARRLHTTEAALDKTSQNLDVLSLLYKQIFDDISSGIITIDSVGTITSFNRAAEEITGYSTLEMLGKKAEGTFSGFTNQNTRHRSVMTIKRRSGEKIPVGYSWAKLHMPGDRGDYRVYTLQDLSKIKQMEAQVKQSEKMAAIGEIAAGIAHEFRNPLAAISGAAQVLNKSIDTNQTNHSLLKIISRECARLENNINDFLQFSKPALPEKTWISIEKAVSESWAIIQQAPSAKQSALTLQIPSNLDCWADQHQFKQVFINLLHNAAMSCENGRCVITVSAREESSSDNLSTIAIEIADNGTGISPETLKKIYDPFYTTKENGTGLGLAIVKQIIESHNGSIRCQSTPGHGTRFTVTLPLPEPT